LVRLLDLIYWVDQKEIDWDKLLFLLNIAGNKTAAWIMLEWLKLLTNTTALPDISQKLQPGNIRKQYLLHWIKQNYSSRLLEKPFLIQAAFTLPAHDNLSDALRAIYSLAKEKHSATIKAKQLASKFST